MADEPKEVTSGGKVIFLRFISFPSFEGKEKRVFLVLFIFPSNHHPPSLLEKTRPPSLFPSSEQQPSKPQSSTYHVPLLPALPRLPSPRSLLSPRLSHHQPRRSSWCSHHYRQGPGSGEYLFLGLLCCRGDAEREKNGEGTTLSGIDDEAEPSLLYLPSSFLCALLSRRTEPHPVWDRQRFVGRT